MAEEPEEVKGDALEEKAELGPAPTDGQEAQPDAAGNENNDSDSDEDSDLEYDSDGEVNFYSAFPPVVQQPKLAPPIFDDDGEPYPPFDECYQLQEQQGAHAGHGGNNGNGEADANGMTMTKSVVKRTKSANFGEPNWSNESEVMGALMGDGLLLEEAPDEYTEGPDGKPFVLAACTQNGLALKFASLDLRDDKDIALAAGKQNWRALQFISKKQRENAELGMIAVAQDFNALQYVAQKVRHNREVIACGIAQDGRALQYAAGNLRKDRELAAYAVANNGLALQFAPEFADDDGIVGIAMEQNPDAVKFTGDAWRAKHNMGPSASTKKKQKAEKNMPPRMRAPTVKVVREPKPVGEIDEEDAAYIQAQVEAKLAEKKKVQREEKARLKAKNQESVAKVKENAESARKQEEERAAKIEQEKREHLRSVRASAEMEGQLKSGAAEKAAKEKRLRAAIEEERKKKLEDTKTQLSAAAQKEKEEKEAAREALRLKSKAEREAAMSASAAAEKAEAARQLQLIKEARAKRTPEQIEEDEDELYTAEEMEARLLEAAQRKAKTIMRRASAAAAAAASSDGSYKVLSCKALSLDLAVEGDQVVCSASAATTPAGSPTKGSKNKSGKGSSSEAAMQWRLSNGYLEHSSGQVLAVVDDKSKVAKKKVKKGRSKNAGPSLMLCEKDLKGTKQTWVFAGSGALTNGGFCLVPPSAAGEACTLAPVSDEVPPEKSWSFA